MPALSAKWCDYSYDHTDQLTAADHDYQADEAYAFDENGNRTMTGYSTGTNNRLLSDGTFNYEHDAEGNRTRRVRISSDPADDYETLYTWDHRNQLTRLVYKDNSGNVTKQIDYTYDVFNRRIAKSIDWDGAGSGSAETVEYVLDGAHLLLALDSAGDPTNRYLHGPAAWTPGSMRQNEAGLPRLRKRLWKQPKPPIMCRRPHRRCPRHQTRSRMLHGMGRRTMLRTLPV